MALSRAEPSGEEPAWPDRPDEWGPVPESSAPQIPASATHAGDDSGRARGDMEPHTVATDTVAPLDASEPVLSEGDSLQPVVAHASLETDEREPVAGASVASTLPDELPGTRWY